MWDVIRAQFPEAVLSSATRTVMTEGHPDNHNAGRAIDLRGDWGNFPSRPRGFSRITAETLELIHSPFDHNVKDRKDVGDGYGFYGSGTMAGHRDHIHWAMDHAPTDVPKLSDEQIQQIVNGTLTFDKLYDSNGKKVDVGDLYGVNEGTRVNSTYDPSLYPWSNDGLTNGPSQPMTTTTPTPTEPRPRSPGGCRRSLPVPRDYTQDFLGVFRISDNIPILEAFKAGVDADDDKGAVGPEEAPDPAPTRPPAVARQGPFRQAGHLGQEEGQDQRRGAEVAQGIGHPPRQVLCRDDQARQPQKSGKISQTEYDKRLANLQEAFYTEQTDADTAYANLKTKRDQENQGFDYQKSIKS